MVNISPCTGEISSTTSWRPWRIRPVFLRGARQTGKSTLVREIANGPYPARYVTLDNARSLSVASADPAGSIAGIEKPVVTDEVQRVRDLFPAIKEDVDRDRSPGRYLFTGSADVLTIPKVSDALAGRMEVRRYQEAAEFPAVLSPAT